MIFFDTDCLSSFLWVNEERLVAQVRPGPLIIPVEVIKELSNPAVPHLGKKVQYLLRNGLMSPGEIMTGTEEAVLFYEMVHRPKEGMYSIGRGEAAALALAKVTDGIVASNNFRDINLYLTGYGLRHITTGYILAHVLEKGLITECKGNSIWKDMLARRRILPTSSFTEYLRCFYARDQSAAGREI